MHLISVNSSVIARATVDDCGAVAGYESKVVTEPEPEPQPPKPKPKPKAEPESEPKPKPTP